MPLYGPICKIAGLKFPSVAKESKTSRYILGFLVVLVFSIKVKDQQILVTGVVRMVVDSNVIVSSIAEAE